MKAIETRYAGCHFRSRLEARWAVFFDYVGATWSYESEGFETAAGPYLPDFKVTWPGWWGYDWLEIKGGRPYGHEVEKVRAFAVEALPVMNGNVYIVIGNIPETTTTEAWDLNPDGTYYEGKLRLASRCGSRTLGGLMAARSARFEHGWSGAS